MTNIRVELAGTQSVRVTVDLPTGPETFDLQSALEYANDIDGALERHASQQATWEYQSVAKVEEVDLFFEQTYETYMTHLRTYARYAARGVGEKPPITMEMSKDFLIRIYSERTSTGERERLSQAAFKGYAIERCGSSRAADDWMSSMVGEDYRKNLDLFYRDMFAWQDASPGKVTYWYEEMIRLKLRKQREKEEYQVIAGAFRTRGYLLRQGAENLKARAMNMGPVTVDEIVEKVRQKLGIEKVVTGVGVGDPRK